MSKGPLPPSPLVHDPRRNNAPICTAHWPDGNPCKLIAEGGTTKCRRHGGKSLKGLASPHYKHGRYSASLPAQLATRYEEYLGSTRLMSLDDEVALNQARLAELLGQVDTGESGATWQALRTARDAFLVAQRVGDAEAMNTHFGAMSQLIADGAKDASVWDDIRQTCDTLCKLITTQTKTLLGLQQFMTVQQHMLMMGAATQVIFQAVQEHADPKVGQKILMKVEQEFTKLATLEGR